MSGVAYRAEHLLHIDVASEVRKLAAAHIEGTWQAPAELVRLAVSSGASHVDVVTFRDGFRVSHDGAPLPDRVMRALRAGLDHGLPLDARHDALVALEERASALLPLLGLEAGFLSVEADHGHCTERMTCHRGRAALESGPPAGRGVRVHVRGLAFDRTRAREWLETAGVFAPLRLLVDGRDVAVGFTDVLAEGPPTWPLVGRLALLRHLDVGRLWLLLDGVVRTHLILPQGPPLAAALEMRPVVRGDDSPGALREAVRPHLGRLVHDGTQLALSLIPRARALAPADLHQVRRALLDAARARVSRSEVLQASVWCTLRDHGTDPAWVSLADLRRPGATDRSLWALEPDRASAGVLWPTAPVLLVTADERSRLTELLGASFRSPQRRPRTTSLASRLRRARVRLRARLARLWGPWGIGWGAARKAVTPAERELGRVLRLTTGVDPSPEFREGRRGVRVRGRQVVLSRQNGLVMAAARALSRDPRLDRVVRLALLGEHARD